MTGRRLVRDLLRATCILSAAGAVAAVAFLWLGPASIEREYHVRNEAKRFTPTVGHGMGQLLGEALLLAVVAYSGRRWLRVRL